MNQDDPGGQSPPPNNSRSLQIVKAGAGNFGIYAEQIATIVPWQKPAPLPQSPASVLGVVSIQGRMLTVLDLEVLTTAESPSIAEAKSHTHIVALRGDEQLAVAVDAIGEAIDITERELLPNPDSTNHLIHQVLEFDNARIDIIDIKELFPTAIQGRERRRRRF